MILQLRQIFFTEANTFISVSRHSIPSRPDGVSSKSLPLLIPVTCSLRPLNHFARNVILARDRSYGVNSTVTLSPGKILM